MRVSLRTVLRAQRELGDDVRNRFKYRLLTPSERGERSVSLRAPLSNNIMIFQDFVAVWVPSISDLPGGPDLGFFVCFTPLRLLASHIYGPFRGVRERTMYLGIPIRSGKQL